MITCLFEDHQRANLRHVVVHALVEQNGKMLLLKRAGPILESGKWSIPAGFLERDETAAEGILRELKEETGWEGEIVSLFRINSHPNRPHEDRQNVALDFIVKPIAQTGTPDHESSNIEWIAFEDIRDPQTFAFDHGESLALYMKYRRHPFALPLIR